MKPNLIIFDMDGTLIDSESLYFKAFSVAGKEFGVPVDLELYKQFIGFPIEHNMKILLDICKNEDTVDSIFQSVGYIVKYLIREEGLQLRPGVKEILDYLKNKGYTLAVATTSPKEHAINNLKVAGIYDYFATIVGGDEVARKKPYPDIYLKVAQIHNVLPDNCIVFEDSRQGLKAAASANTTAFLVPDMLEPTEEMTDLAFKVLDVITDAIPFIE